MIQATGNVKRIVLEEEKHSIVCSESSLPVSCTQEKTSCHKTCCVQ